ncbi:MAG: hypothetical protein BWK76_11785 [Desulfobulbaceae bacterium A2]|nr:MAG: hypothetical protein BWK76_11785 [Desulfobulbaceae bacterium A2]
MNKILLLAALLAAGTAAIHIVAGGADIATPLLASSLATEPKLTLYAAWHMVSLILVVSALALALGSLPGQVRACRAMVLFISVLWCSFGVLFLGIAMLHPESGGLFSLPQWTLLLPVGLLGLWGRMKGEE